VIRDGESMKIDVPVEYDSNLLIPYLEGKYPRHFIVGPLVFTTSSQELVSALGAARQALASRKNPLIARRFDRVKNPNEELVLMAPRFPHSIAEGYDDQVFAVVSHINDVEIKNLDGLVQAIRDAEGKYIVIKFFGSYETMVFHRQELIDSTEQILEDEGIRYQMSPDLRSIWNGD
jgi:hypothetical protein